MSGRDFHELPPYIVMRGSFRKARDNQIMVKYPRITAAILLFLAQLAPLALAAPTAQSGGPATRVAATTTRPGKAKPKDTAAFQQAIDTCAANGGGTVQIGPGNYLIGSIQLRTGVTLELQKGALVTGSPDPNDYPMATIRYEGAMVQGHRAMIWAEDAHDIAILGPGTIQGDNRIGNLRNPRGPVMVELTNCQRILLDGFTDKYRRLWSIHLLFCKDVTAQNLMIRTILSNGDGIDVDSSTDVLIQNCDIDTGDDCISLKSGRGISAVKLGRPTERVLIRNCAFGSGFAGIGIGSEMSGGIGDVEIENCVFNHGMNAIYIKGRMGRGGFFENIDAHDLKVNSKTRAFLGLNFRDAGIIGIDPVGGEAGIPVAKNFRFTNVDVNCDTLLDGARILPGKPLDGLVFSDISGKSRRGIMLANTVNVSLDNVNVAVGTGPFLQTRNVSGSGLEKAVALKVPMLEDPQQLQAAFAEPPDNTRPMVRWWWFGPAVAKEQLEHEMEMMKQGGFGGFEVQPTYPLSLDGGVAGLVNLKFMSPEFLGMLGFVAGKAKDLGLRMDLTIGSGWPYGGPSVSLDDAAERLRVEHVSTTQPSVSPAQMRSGDSLLAAFSGSTTRPIPIEQGVAKIPTSQPSHEVTFFIAGHTGMKVKRPAFGADGYVVDHQSATAIKDFIHNVAEPEVAACGQNPPYAIFCDSLESYGEDWTAKFLAEFRKRRGYELTPLLLALVTDIGPKTGDIRYDYGRTLTELFNDDFARQMHEFADEHETRFRIQAYGTPSAGLYSYLDSDLPEGEGYQWHDYRATRYASSAAHLMGVPVSSSETFTWIHSAPFRATPLDIKAEADLHFLQGVNQIICHGWPSTPAGVGFPGWSFYAAGVFDDQNPWYIVMPDVNRYIQRVCFMLRQGNPANDIALYLPNSDAWARFTPGKVSLTDDLGECLGHKIVGDILDAGYNLDFFDDQMLDNLARMDSGSMQFSQTLRYRVIVLAGVERMPLSTARKLLDFATKGGQLIATRTLPTIVPGYKATAADQNALRQIMHQLFQGDDAPGVFVADESNFASALEAAKRMRPDMRLTPSLPEVGFVHRATEGAAIYFLANTSNEPKSFTADLRYESMYAEQMDPLSGKITPAQILAHPEGYTSLHVDLAPYGSTIFMLTNRMATEPPATRPAATPPPAIDLSRGWSVAFGAGGKASPIGQLHSWADDGATRSFSGVATYTNEVTVSADVATASRVLLDFGPATALAPPQGRVQGFAALLEGPVREAAVVYINDKRAGTVWCAPYQVDVTGLLSPGKNDIRVQVANTALNYLSEHGFPNYDYRGVTETFGPRFQAPPASQYRPIASGLVGPVTLIPSAQ
jgi:hypothetical protein